MRKIVRFRWIFSRVIESPWKFIFGFIVVILFGLNFTQVATIINPISTPESFSGQFGYSPPVVADMLRDQIQRINKAARTYKERRIFASASEIENIVVPGSDLSIRSFISLIRKWIGAPIKLIDGSIVKVDQTYQLNLKIAGYDREILEIKSDIQISSGVDKIITDLVRRGAQAVLRKIDPYVLASYLRHREPRTSMDIAFDIVASGPKEDVSWAELLIGNHYLDGSVGWKNYKEAYRWYSRAIQNKNAVALNNIALLYLQGKGVAQNFTEAMRLFRQSADMGHSTAYTAIALMYKDGQGVPADMNKAINWFEQGAEKGDSVAMIELAKAFSQGVGVPRSYVRAADWLRKASINGSSKAKFMLGKAYRNGEGVPKSDLEALRWLTKAAVTGDADAYVLIGDIYIHSNELASDPIRAFVAYNCALAQMRSPQATLELMMKMDEYFTKIPESEKSHAIKLKEQINENSDVCAAYISAW